MSSRYARRAASSSDPVTGQRKDAPWKEDLRRRCVQRAQEHRRQLLARRRDAPSGEDDAVPMDAQALCREIVSSEMLSGGGGDDPWAHLSHDAYIELMTATEQTLLQELRADVAVLADDDEVAAAQYEEYLRSEDERMQALLEEAEADGHGGPALHEEHVPCPLCEHGAVWQTLGTLECSRCASHGCTFRLLTHDHPAPLLLLRERLGTLLGQHAASGCCGAPRCRLPVPGEQSLLLLGCDVCGVQVSVV